MKKTILVVDDEQAVTLAVELLLSDKYTTLKAGTGEEALLIIEAQRPDAVILDVMMPGIGGLETVRLIRAQKAFKSLPVLLMSGVRPLARKQDFGWTDFILKPFTATDLMSRIQSILAH